LASMQVSIPLPGKTESLNGGVAGAVLMFEVVRQRT
jgi:tRNA G18 (ribose-2'-O)-methylase SpoU